MLTDSGKYYAGVGSRKIHNDKPAMDKCKQIAVLLREKGYGLRSGAAMGADTAFEVGHGNLNKQIFIPGKGFVSVLEPHHFVDAPLEAFWMAAAIHPAWEKLSWMGKKLHARNICQVLGPNLDNPSKYVLWYTADGTETGGTRTAIIAARNHGIPEFGINSGFLANMNARQIVEFIIS